MFFFLASLPKDSFKILEEVFKKYETGSLVKLPKAKLNCKMGKVDCKYVVIFIVLSLAFSTTYMCIHIYLHVHSKHPVLCIIAI